MIEKQSKFKYAFIGVLLSVLFIGKASAQQTIVSAKIDSAAMLIGEQTLIHLEVTIDKGKSLQFPIFPDTIMNGVEVIEMPKADTVDLGSNRIQIKQDYLVTSFDSALYLLPPFLVIVDQKDSVYSDQVALKISTFPVDTNTKNFYDIKDVIKPPFVFSDYLWILWILLGLIVVSLLAILIIKKMSGRPGTISIKKKEPELPPHVRAIKDLDDVKIHKIWQQGRTKEYHSRITDILRKYIEDRFGTAAMEMTSGEILTKLRNLSDADPVYDNLKQILQLADFVKFAKYNPLPDENQLSLINAYMFVNQTKKEENTETQKTADQVEKNNEQ